MDFELIGLFLSKVGLNNFKYFDPTEWVTYFKYFDPTDWVEDICGFQIWAGFRFERAEANVNPSPA